MENSLPARPSLEQLKKLAKDLVRQHRDKEPGTLALMRKNLPVLAGKSDGEIAAFSFALHDAQSAVARQHGFSSWKDLREYMEKAGEEKSKRSIPDPVVTAQFQIICKAWKQNDHPLFCSIANDYMKAGVTKKHFEKGLDKIAPYFNSAFQTAYMGSMLRKGMEVHFWRVWVHGWENDLLVRMNFNFEGLVGGLLFSDPFSGVIKPGLPLTTNEERERDMTTPDPIATAQFQILCEAEKQKDYAVFTSVVAESMRAAVTEKHFRERHSKTIPYFQAAEPAVYMGSMLRSARRVHFWDFSAPGQPSDLLVRMSLNSAGLIEGLLYSDPYTVLQGN